MRAIRTILGGLMLCLVLPGLAMAADRAKVRDFLQVTGFDVALESIRLSARSAPEMLGMAAEDFGTEWTRLTNDIFATDIMHDMAVDILEETLSDELLEHATAFYGSDLGQRLVATENAAHMNEDSTLTEESGAAILDGLESIDSPRVDYLRQLNAASDSAGTSIRAITEVQVRFLMAAASAGVIELQMEEPDLRALLSADMEEMKAEMEAGSLVWSADTYQAFSDDEVLAYARALEHPRMRAVYDLMNVVQYEIMANRFEALAIAMQGLQPSQEL